MLALKEWRVCLLPLLLAACGAGGGGGQDYGLDFIDEVPSEAMLCTLTIGVSTRSDVEAVLGEPTNFSESGSGAILQYWYGTYEEFSTGNGRMIVLSLDAEEVFDSPMLDGISFPQCWREQLAVE